jgi:hypothetical protein
MAKGADACANMVNGYYGVTLDDDPKSVRFLEEKFLFDVHQKYKAGEFEKPGDMAFQAGTMAGVFLGELLRKTLGFKWVNESADPAVGGLDGLCVVFEGCVTVRAYVLKWCYKRIVEGPVPPGMSMRSTRFWWTF